MCPLCQQWGGHNRGQLMSAELFCQSGYLVSFLFWIISAGLEYVIKNTYFRSTPIGLSTCSLSQTSLSLISKSFPFSTSYSQMAIIPYILTSDHLSFLARAMDDQVHHPKSYKWGRSSFTIVFLALPWAELDSSYSSFSAWWHIPSQPIL